MVASKKLRPIEMGKFTLSAPKSDRDLLRSVAELLRYGRGRRGKSIRESLRETIDYYTDEDGRF